MTTNEGFDRRLSSWLEADAVQRVPDHLDQVLIRTAATRQQPWWSSLERWLPMDLTARRNTFNQPRLGRILLVAVLALAIAGAVLLIAGSRQPHVPAPFGPAVNGRIGYWTGGDIWLADADGANAHAVVTGGTDDIALLYARDGTRFAFWRVVGAHTAMLMVAAADGSDVRPVLPSPLTDSDWYEWSPDSRSLAVVHSIGDERVLSIVDVDGGAIRKLDTGGLPVDNDVYWRPGQSGELVFTVRQGTDPQVTTGIYRIEADGTDFGLIAPLKTGPAEYNGLDIAPDGQTLTYWRWQDGKGSRIHRLDIASGQDQELLFDPTDTGETDLQHSPDGSTAVFQREDTQAQLMVAPVDASRPGVLIGPTFSTDADVAYGFSPDGKAVWLEFPGNAPKFFDAASGESRPAPTALSECCSWQRLAP